MLYLVYIWLYYIWYTVSYAISGIQRVVLYLVYDRLYKVGCVIFGIHQVMLYLACNWFYYIWYTVGYVIFGIQLIMLYLVYRYTVGCVLSGIK